MGIGANKTGWIIDSRYKVDYFMNCEHIKQTKILMWIGKITAFRNTWYSSRELEFGSLYTCLLTISHNTRSKDTDRHMWNISTHTYTINKN